MKQKEFLHFPLLMVVQKIVYNLQFQRYSQILTKKEGLVIRLLTDFRISKNHILDVVHNSTLNMNAISFFRSKFNNS